MDATSTPVSEGFPATAGFAHPSRASIAFLGAGTWRTINNGFIVVEVPITFTEREFGQSKMSGSNIREALFKVAEWGIRGRPAEDMHLHDDRGGRERAARATVKTARKMKQPGPIWARVSLGR